MKENLMIVPIHLRQSPPGPTDTETNTYTPLCHFKMNEAEITFYNSVDKHILHAILV